MTLVLLGDADDARGFRLAGVESRVCRTRGDVDRAIADLFDGGGQTGVVLVSEPVYRIAPDAIAPLMDRPRWPILAVLPEPEDGERRAP